VIGRIKGILIEKNPPGLVIDVQGLGYELEATMPTFYGLPATGNTVELHTHLIVREDAHLLFGFATQAERSVFRALLKVSGVGAKVALSILSGMTSDEFLACIAKKDVAALTKVPGIGKKTAERLIVEMHDKVEKLGGSATLAGTPSVGASSVRQQAEEALLTLGYKDSEAKRLLDKSAVDGQSVEEMIRAALRSIKH
jgi:Holliday junction DNA helicase RuvA